MSNLGFHWAISGSSDDEELMLIPNNPEICTAPHLDAETVESKVLTSVPTPQTPQLPSRDLHQQPSVTPFSTPVRASETHPIISSHGP